MTVRRSLAFSGLMILGFAMSSAMRLALPETTAPVSAGDTEGVRAATVLTIHGTVTAVDKAEKLVTIQVPDGLESTRSRLTILTTSMQLMLVREWLCATTRWLVSGRRNPLNPYRAYL
jgi:hypothetical protein